MMLCVESEPFKMHWLELGFDWTGQNRTGVLSCGGHMLEGIYSARAFDN